MPRQSRGLGNRLQVKGKECGPEWKDPGSVGGRTSFTCEVGKRVANWTGPRRCETSTRTRVMRGPRLSGASIRQEAPNARSSPGAHMPCIGDRVAANHRLYC